MAVLVAGCGPAVEEDDDFIERQCTQSCDRIDACGRGFGDCQDVCTELTLWEPESCEEVTAEYLQCLRDLTCEDMAARADAVENEERPLPTLPCDEEMFAASICAN